MQYYGSSVKRSRSSHHRQSQQSWSEALEAVIEWNNTPTSLPVLTIGAPPRVLSSRAYAERVATRLLEVLLDVEQYRGTGRLYLP